MSVLFIVLPLALLIVGAAVWAFVGASLSGQFDDLETPAVRMLHDDGQLTNGRQVDDQQPPRSRRVDAE